MVLTRSSKIKITLRQTLLAIHTFGSNLMKLPAIFEVLEHVNNFLIIGYVSHFVFKN